jgi:hypothetical protein
MRAMACLLGFSQFMHGCVFGVFELFWLEFAGDGGRQFYAGFSS